MGTPDSPFIIDDYGSALTGTGTIDIYHPTLEGMRKWGRRNVEIIVISWGSFQKSDRILAGRAHHAHCRAMLEDIRRRLARGLPALLEPAQSHR